MLLSDIDTVRRINIQRLRWLGHVVLMEEKASAKVVFHVGIGEKDDLVSVVKTSLV